jgi:Tat protein translocase TatC
MTAPAYHQDPGPEQPFMSHLVELRDRLLRMVMAIGIALVVLFPFANDIYTFIAEPIRAQLPEGSTMIATQVASPFMTPFKLALVSAMFVAMPYLLFQLWGFVAPGLYQHEKRFAMPLLASSIVLFYLGMAFAYYLVFPLIFAFFTATTPEGVAQMPDITYYLDFVLKLFFAFGISFQIPIATILLVAMGMTTAESLADKRPYVIVGCFVIGMLLDPTGRHLPDPARGAHVDAVRGGHLLFALLQEAGHGGGGTRSHRGASPGRRADRRGHRGHRPVRRRLQRRVFTLIRAAPARRRQPRPLRSWSAETSTAATPSTASASSP